MGRSKQLTEVWKVSRPLVSEVENQLTGKSVGIGLDSFFAIKVNGVFICLWQSFIRKSGETIISFLALQRLNMKHCFWCGPPVQAAHEETEEGYKWRATQLVSIKPTRRGWELGLFSLEEAKRQSNISLQLLESELQRWRRQIFLIVTGVKTKKRQN